MEGHQVPGLYIYNMPCERPRAAFGFFQLGILCEKMFGQAELIALHSKVMVLVVLGLYQWLFHRENAGTLRMVPCLFNPPRSPLKRYIPNKYPLYKVYMGLSIRGTIPRLPAFSLRLFLVPLIGGIGSI